MHSGFEVPAAGIQHHRHHHHQQPLQHNIMSPENTCPTAPVLLSPPQTNNILEQIHTSLPTTTTQQLLLDQHHFLPPQIGLHHQYIGGGALPPAAFFPVNFKLGLNEICRGGATDNNSTSVMDKSNKLEGTSSGGCINEGHEGANNLFRGSEQYAVPEARHSSIGMHHCWQNQHDSSIKQQPQPFSWEAPPAEVSNENSEIVDRQENLEMRGTTEESLTNCLESKNRLLFGELEAIYKRLGTTESNQTGPSELNQLPVNPKQLPVLGFDRHGSEACIGEDASASASASASESLKNTGKKRKKKKKKAETGYDRQMISPMARFFESLVKQVVDHQENLHKKFADVIERLDGERREREVAWRNQEIAHLKEEAEARAHEKALAASREATIVSYLEKITGQRINLPPFNHASDDVFRKLDEGRNGLELNPPGS